MTAIFLNAASKPKTELFALAARHFTSLSGSLSSTNDTSKQIPLTGSLPNAFRQENPAKISTSSRCESNYISDPENKGKATPGVNFDTLGCWNNRLQLPILYDQSVRRGKIIPKVPVDEIAVASVIGRRKVNEDRYVIEEIQPDLLYFGIFDGHGGSFAADYMLKNLCHHINFWLTQTKDLKIALKNSFCDAQNLLARHLAFYHIDSDTFRTGTTATVCLLRNSTELVVAHVGDSVGVLCRQGESRRLSVDHAPDNQDETDRIKGRGGSIIHNSHGVAHVNGRLAMTRSFGDVDLKSFGVTAHPQMKSVEIKHGKDAFLLLFSDGLGFSVSDDEAVSLVCSSATPHEAVNRLVDQAQTFGSEDNVTVMVVPLGAWGKYQDTSTKKYNFGRLLSHSRIY